MLPQRTCIYVLLRRRDPAVRAAAGRGGRRLIIKVLQPLLGFWS